MPASRRESCKIRFSLCVWESDPISLSDFEPVICPMDPRKIVTSASFLFLMAGTGLSSVGVTGKIFHVDVGNRSLELLKETEYDPKTDMGLSRVTVHWTEQTTIRKVEEKTSFAGIKGPVIAEFRGIDAANTKALAARKPFVTRVATLLGGVAALPKENIIDNQVTAWFTPDDRETRSGHIELDGKNVAVSLRGSNWQIIHQQPMDPSGLAEGFWQATLTCSEADGRLVIDHMDVSPLADTRATDDPKLPRVLVVGDSISMNYHDSAKAALAGIANYHRNDGNSGSSANGVRNMELWLGNYHEKGLHWDVIQFNHGLHDLKQAYEPSGDMWGDYSVSIDDYKSNIEKEIAILRRTGAKLVWCSTTPVPNSNPGTYARRKGASAIFNQAAMEVMRGHPDILINDLHLVVDASPVFDPWRKQNDVHFYQEAERKLLGDAVATVVRSALADEPMLNIPIRFHITQGATMTVKGQEMKVWVTPEEVTGPVLAEINRIWKPGRVRFTVERAQFEPLLQPGDFYELLKVIENAKRGVPEKPGAGRTAKIAKLLDPAHVNHDALNVYLLPYIGMTYQGYARIGGNQARKKGTGSDLARRT